MTSPSRPASRNSSKRSWGYSLDSSISRARGFTLSCASLRTDSWSARSSSERAKSIAQEASCACAEVLLRGLAALADHAAPFPFGRPAPDTVVLAVSQGELEARLANRAHGTDGLGLTRVILGHR